MTTPATSLTPVQPILSGPARLRLMPAGQQAALDPYMAQIVTYRKSGLSLNHIIGCPLDCGYCVRHFWGDFEDKTPHLLCPDAQAIEMLTSHHAFRPHTTPIQLLNKATDPFLPGVRPHLFRVLHALDERGLPTWSWSSPGSGSPRPTWPSWKACGTCASPCCSPTPASPTPASSPSPRAPSP